MLPTQIIINKFEKKITKKINKFEFVEYSSQFDFRGPSHTAS